MNETIVALSTALPAAIGVIRLSGEKAISAVETLFRPSSGGLITEKNEKKLIFGQLLDKKGKVIDQVLATYSKAPFTYTGEDTAEVHCHGSPMVIAMALEAFFALGCRQAEAGEFTQRSFLNGKLDLTQAEGVADLISANSVGAVHQAVGQLGGKLSQKIEEIYSDLAGLMAHFCAVLDYPDEDIDEFGEQTILSTLETQKKALIRLEESWKRGKLVVHGIPCALVGLPNAGKSSLLNALLGYDRAIVTPVAGTTRDTIEAEISLGELSLRLVDTAGLRETEDPIEKMGVERSRQAMEEAQLVLVVIDGSKPLTGEEPVAPEGVHCICVLNKADKHRVIEKKDLKFTHICEVSAKEEHGLVELQKVILSIFKTNSDDSEQVLLSNQRQVQQVQVARSHIEGAMWALTSGLPADATLTDVEGAMKALGELTGKSVPADITKEIFTRFCVGK